MKKQLLAKRYAKALFSIIKKKEGNSLQNYADILSLLAKACETNPLLLRVFENPIIAHTEKLGIISTLLTEFWEQFPYIVKFCTVLVESDRIHLIQEIASCYQSFVDCYVGRVIVRVTTSFPLDDEDKQSIQSSLSGLGTIVDIGYIVEPTLLGGMLLSVGDIHIDASLRKELESIRKRIIKGGMYAN